MGWRKATWTAKIRGRERRTTRPWPCTIWREWGTTRGEWRHLNGIKQALQTKSCDILPWNPGGGGPIPGGGKGEPPGGPITPGGRPPGPGGNGGRAYRVRVWSTWRTIDASCINAQNPGGPPKPGGTNPGPLGVRCCGPNPKPPGGGPPPDS